LAPAPGAVTAAALSASSIRVTFNAVDGASSYSAYRNGVSIGPVTTSFDDTGLGAGIYTYTVRAVNSRGEGPGTDSNSVNLQNVQTGDGAATYAFFGLGSSVSSAVRFNPGFLICPDTYSPSLASVQAAINAAPANVRGIQVAYGWKDLETAQGNYSAAYAAIDAILGYCAVKTAARGTYFGMMLYIDSYTRPPSWLTAFDGGNGTYLAGTTRVCSWWRPAVYNAIIARDQALLTRYDNNPNFEMHCGPMGETSQVFDLSGAAGIGYSAANWDTPWTTWMQAVSPYAVKSQIRVIANFMSGGWSAMNTLIQNAATYRVALGGPDVYTRFTAPVGTNPYTTDFGMVFHGYTKGSGSWVRDGTRYDLTGTYCVIHDAQDPEMGGKETTTATGTPPNFPAAADLYAQSVAEGDHYLVWWQKQFCWTGTDGNGKRQLYWDNSIQPTTNETNGRFTPDIKTYLTNNTLPLNTTRPGYYS
jgi:hypothetical protein